MKSLMMSKSLRQRSLHDSSVSDTEINQEIERLLKGGSVAAIPTRLCQPVISTLTHQRKNAILQRQNALAEKIEIILGEIQHGPQKFEVDTPGDPLKERERLLVKNPPLYNDDSD